MIQKKKLSEAIGAAAQYLLANQVTQQSDANRGRFVGCVEEAANRADLCNSWQVGGGLMALLAMFKRTGETNYLDAAEIAGHYIMALQVMDSREPRFYGGIREVTPMTAQFCPRDATTAAWALVWLYEATKCAEYLDRAILFAEWHLKYGMCEGWPRWWICMDGKRP